MNHVWWVRPAWAALVMGSVGPLFAAAFSDEAFAEYWGTRKFFTPMHFWVTITMLAVLLIGIAVGQAGTRGTRPIVNIDPDRLQKANNWLFRVTLFGYAAWLFVGVARGLTPALAFSVVEGTPGAIESIKELLRPVGGLTTLTQVGPVAAVGVYIESQLLKTSRVRIYVLLALALFRAVFYAERLAILEIAVPLVIVAVGFPGRQLAVAARQRLAIVPILGPFVLAALFGAFEYLRSWTNYYSTISDQSYVSFTITRLAGYYATASNNSALIVEEFGQALPLPYYAVRGGWSAPGVQQLGGYAGATGVSPEEEWRETLIRLANPEFNNEGGLLPITTDFGIIGAGLYWLAIGLVLGLIYKSFASGRPIGLLLYPTSFIGLLELSRFDYWSLGRYLPVLVACIIVAVALRRSASPRVETHKFARTRA